MSMKNINGPGPRVDFAYSLTKSLAPKAPLKLEGQKDHPIEAILSISQEAQALLEAEKQQFFGLDDYSPEELDAMFEQIKNSTDDSNNPMKIQLQCLQIAMRIISGDNVPMKDRAFLAEHEPEMLGRAMLLRRTKENPKDYKSLLADEKADEPANSLGKLSLSQGETSCAESISIDDSGASDNPTSQD